MLAPAWLIHACHGCYNQIVVVTTWKLSNIHVVASTKFNRETWLTCYHAKVISTKPVFYISSICWWAHLLYCTCIDVPYNSCPEMYYKIPSCVWLHSLVFARNERRMITECRMSLWWYEIAMDASYNIKPNDECILTWMLQNATLYFSSILLSVWILSYFLVL